MQIKDNERKKNVESLICWPTLHRSFISLSRSKKNLENNGNLLDFQLLSFVICLQHEKVFAPQYNLKTTTTERTVIYRCQLASIYVTWYTGDHKTCQRKQRQKSHCDVFGTICMLIATQWGVELLIKEFYAVNSETWYATIGDGTFGVWWLQSSWAQLPCPNHNMITIIW